MSTISLKLPDALLKASSRYAESLRLSRSAYIRRSIERMNREIERRQRADRLAKASRKVRSESLRVNEEFAAFEREPDA